MKLSLAIRGLTMLAVLTLSAEAALCIYSQPASTISAGGGVSTSANYENLGVVGQPAIVGTSTSTAYTVSHGFLPVLGDGFKILYPVISATPGTLTFTLMSGASASQDVNVGNTGGSTLNWTVAKQSTDSIFQINKSSGTNTGTVTVTANAASLPAGTYSNILIINGAGIDQTALVQLDLTVSAAPTLYTLAVTLKLATPGKGGGTITSTVPDGRLSCQRTGGANDVTCQADFPSGTVTLHQTPDSNTQWATWGAPGCGSNPSCQIVLDAPKGADVTFPYAAISKVISNGIGYESLVSAYAAATTSDTINVRAVTFTEGSVGSTVLLNGGKTINLVGGLNAYYLPTSGFTAIQNVLKVGSGRLTIKGGLKIHP